MPNSPTSWMKKPGDASDESEGGPPGATPYESPRQKHLLRKATTPLPPDEPPNDTQRETNDGTGPAPPPPTPPAPLIAPIEPRRASVVGDPLASFVSDKMMEKAKISAKRASVAKLQSRFDRLAAGNESFAMELKGATETERIVFANVEGILEIEEREDGSSFRNSQLGDSQSSAAPNAPPLSNQPSTRPSSMSARDSTNTISDTMIYAARKASRRASLKKSIAELKLLKEGSDPAVVEEDIVFAPVIVAKTATSVEPVPSQAAETRRKKFALATIFSNVGEMIEPEVPPAAQSPAAPASDATESKAAGVTEDVVEEVAVVAPAVKPVDQVNTTPASPSTIPASVQIPAPELNVSPTGVSTIPDIHPSTVTIPLPSIPNAPLTLPPPMAPSIDHLESVHVMDVVELIANGPPNLQSLLEDDLQNIKTNKDTLRILMKDNFLLHHDVLLLDEQIKMLIKNRITVEEIAHNFSHLIPQKDGEGEEIVRATLSQEQQILYGQMFYELQKNPSYIVKAARVCTGSVAMGNFTNTVLLTVFGDQYDNSEEQLLLVMLKELLKTEFDSAKEVGTFMRTNSCLTQMLSTYVRRPGSINAIQEMLGPILEEIIERKDSLEINPHKVYMELINEFEQSTGEKSELERNVLPEAAAENEEVKTATATRLRIIVEYVEKILKALEDSFESILYGIRYLTLQLKVMAKEKWPEITDSQTNAIMGGFFFLRFLNPIIVTPDGHNITSKKCGKVPRRNLTLVAKVLQNLSNGVVFGAKEAFFTPVNSYIEGNAKRLENLFGKLSNVEDVDEAMEMDQFLLINTVELTSSKVLKITYNEIMQFHTLLKDNFKEIIPSTEPLARVVFMLQTPKKEVPRSENTTFSLTLDPLSLAERNSTTGQVRKKGPRLSVWDREVNTRGRAVSKTNEIAKLGMMGRASSVSDANQELEKQTKLRLSMIFAKLELQFDEVMAHFGGKKSEITLQKVLQHGKGVLQARLQGGKESGDDIDLLEEINIAIEDVVTLREEVYCNLDDVKDGEDADFEILREVHDAYVLMNKAQVKVARNVHRLKGALDTIQMQHDDLNDQIGTWKAYLDNVKAMAMGGKSKSGGDVEKKKREQAKKLESSKRGWFGKSQVKKVDRVSFTYPELVKKSVIVKSEIPGSAQSSVNFTFRVSPEVPGMFVVTATVRGFEAHRATVLLEDLLGEQERGMENYEMDNVTLSVNMLIHLLNVSFGNRTEST